MIKLLSNCSRRTKSILANFAACNPDELQTVERSFSLLWFFFFFFMKRQKFKTKKGFQLLSNIHVTKFERDFLSANVASLKSIKR